MVPVDFGTPETGETMRGGRRPRSITRDDAAVWCPGGRWGRRRVRVTECRAVLTAETLYTFLLRDDPATLEAGTHAIVRWTVRDTSHPHVLDRCVELECEVRPNAVWRFGRVFLRCPNCGRLATRLYLPTADVEPACRRCWGLTYESRQRRN